MHEPYTLITAIFSAIAACLAAYATWKAPTAAARLADALRREGDRAQERHRSKLAVFTTLMQERAAFYSENGVRALNLIDVVFNESREVREAWADLFIAFNPNSNIPYHVQEERLRRLLAAMAKDVGLAEQLRTDDLSRVYFPTALAQERFIRDMQRQQTPARLQDQILPTASTATPQNTLWPPRPE
jgi:uncharacterized protein DUF6680